MRGCRDRPGLIDMDFHDNVRKRRVGGPCLVLVEQHHSLCTVPGGNEGERGSGLSESAGRELAWAAAGVKECLLVAYSRISVEAQ